MAEITGFPVTLSHFKTEVTTTPRTPKISKVRVNAWKRLQWESEEQRAELVRRAEDLHAEGMLCVPTPPEFVHVERADEHSIFMMDENMDEDEHPDDDDDVMEAPQADDPTSAHNSEQETTPPHEAEAAQLMEPDPVVFDEAALKRQKTLESVLAFIWCMAVGQATERNLRRWPLERV